MAQYVLNYTFNLNYQVNNEKIKIQESKFIVKDKTKFKSIHKAFCNRAGYQLSCISLWYVDRLIYSGIQNDLTLKELGIVDGDLIYNGDMKKGIEKYKSL